MQLHEILITALGKQGLGLLQASKAQSYLAEVCCCFLGPWIWGLEPVSSAYVLYAIHLRSHEKTLVAALGKQALGILQASNAQSYLAEVCCCPAAPEIMKSGLRPQIRLQTSSFPTCAITRALGCCAGQSGARRQAGRQSQVLLGWQRCTSRL